MKRLLLWLLMVVVFVALLLGGTVGAFYYMTGPDDMPEESTTFGGVTLENAGYDWRVPIFGGVIYKSFYSPATLSQQKLGDFGDTRPELVLPSWVSQADLTLTGPDGTTAFQGSAQDYADFVYTANGEYTLQLTLRQLSEEKPAKPKSTNASMGIYCFNWQVLRDALIADEENANSSNDFGKNIIPSLLAAGHKMMAYPFNGYWKDVGTIDSLWEANMDLLGKEPAFQLRGDKRSTIYARNSAMPSSYIDEQAEIVNAFVAEGSEVYGTVHHSIISIGCTVGEGALVEDSVVMPGVVIESGAIVRHAILGEDSRVCKNAIVGGAYAGGEKKKISVTSKGAVVEANTVLKPGDML